MRFTNETIIYIALLIVTMYAIVMTVINIYMYKKYKNVKNGAEPVIIHELERYDGIEDLSIFEVAKYLLELNCRLNTQRLHKLCYFLQIEFLKKYNKPLFKENFVRWRTGPVCVPLHSFFIDRGKSVINVNDFEVTSKRITKIQKRDIKEMLKDYETYDTVTLSLLANERELMDRFNIGDVIDNETLVEYYNK